MEEAVLAVHRHSARPIHLRLWATHAIALLNRALVDAVQGKYAKASLVSALMGFTVPIRSRRAFQWIKTYRSILCLTARSSSTMLLGSREDSKREVANWTVHL